MAVLRSAEVIQTVGKSERLGIGQAFAQLFDAPVDVAAVYVELFDDFAFERYAEAEHAVRGRVLRTDVDDVLVLLEEHVAAADDAAVGLELVARRTVVRHFVGHTERIGFPALVVVLAERIPHPVVAQVEAPHVGMVDEADTEEVEHFALVQLGPLPDVADRRQTALLAARGEDFQYDVFSRRGRFEVIDGTQPLFAPVHTRQAAQKIEAQRRIVVQIPGQIVELFDRDGEHPVAGLRIDGSGYFCRNYLLQVHTFFFSSGSTFSSGRSAVRSSRSRFSYSFLSICRLTSPKNFCSLTLRCSCIIP